MKYCPRCATPLEMREHAGRSRACCPQEGCGFVFWDNPLPVVAAIVEHEGNVILVRNHGWPENMFGLVTGFLERGETPEEGVLRELHEELGLEGEIVRLVGVYPFAQRNELIVAFHVRARGAVKLGDELAAFKSIATEKLRPWNFGTGLAVTDWLASRA
ncbi:MAG: NUDIX domain-containing protein [Polyangiales bacterium]